MDYRLVLLFLFVALVASVFYSQSCTAFRTAEHNELRDLVGESMTNAPHHAPHHAPLGWNPNLAPADFRPDDRSNWNAATMGQADRAQHDAAQCARTNDILDRTKTFLEENTCSRPDVFADDRVNINKNLDCRYRDDQKIEALISEETWCGPAASTTPAAPATTN